jgi:hypothetical protein
MILMHDIAAEHHVVALAQSATADDIESLANTHH